MDFKAAFYQNTPLRLLSDENVYQLFKYRQIINKNNNKTSVKLNAWRHSGCFFIVRTFITLLYCTYVTLSIGWALNFDHYLLQTCYNVLML